MEYKNVNFIKIELQENITAKKKFKKLKET